MATINLERSASSNGGSTCKLIITTTKKIRCSRVRVYLQGKEKKAVTNENWVEAGESTTSTTCVFYTKNLDDRFCITEKLMAGPPGRPRHLPKGTHCIPIEIELPDNLPPIKEEFKVDRRDHGTHINVTRSVHQISYKLKVQLEGSGTFFDYKVSFPYYHPALCATSKKGTHLRNQHKKDARTSIDNQQIEKRLEHCRALQETEPQMGPATSEDALVAAAYQVLRNDTGPSALLPHLPEHILLWFPKSGIFILIWLIFFGLGLVEHL